MSIHYIFIHGWGTDSNFWERMKKYFPANCSHFIDLGFIGENPKNETHSAPGNSPKIYITHSLGTLWALKNKAYDIDVLITINGFYRFKDFTDKRTLCAMKIKLEKDPALQMDAFWERSEITKKTPHLNLQRLQEGLVWLSEINASEELRSLSGPVLCLGGKADPILSYEQMKKEWSGFSIKILPEGGHIVPWTHPDWCAQNIKEFVDGLKLEK